MLKTPVRSCAPATLPGVYEDLRFSLRPRAICRVRLIVGGEEAAPVQPFALRVPCRHEGLRDERLRFFLNTPKVCFTEKTLSINFVDIFGSRWAGGEPAI